MLRLPFRRSAIISGGFEPGCLNRQAGEIGHVGRIREQLLDAAGLVGHGLEVALTGPVAAAKDLGELGHDRR